MMQNQKMASRPSYLPAASLDANALTILERRFLKKDSHGLPCESPEDLFWRVALNIAEADRLYDPQADVLERAAIFYRQMIEKKFLPNTPCLRSAGRNSQQLFACFVLPIEDSLESIFDTLKHAALIHKTGGGTGFSFSKLRSKGAVIKSTDGVSGGPLSFMRIFNAATAEVTQGGVRLGANMGILRVDHPDIEAFITCKADGVSMTNFNLSVSVTDAFMEAFEKNEEYALINPQDGSIAGMRSARDIFDAIARNAWHHGDPGVVFMDRINASESNMVPAIGTIESTNPCGEQPLLPYESCVLGSINLSRFVENKKVCWETLAETVAHAVHFLDNTIDMNRYPLPAIEKMAKGLRRIGLGVMGFADMLIMLDIPYNSEQAVDMAEKIMSFVNDEARKTSERCAEERGAFPWFEKSLFYERGEKPLRNVARTTIAPTGTISTIAGCSGGIEPIFALVHKRKSLWTEKGATAELFVTNTLFEERLRKEGVMSPELMEEVAVTGTVAHSDKVPAELKRIFVTSHEIAPEWHIRVQAAFQRHVNNAVSKTINMPHEATIDDVKNAYLLSYRLGCKGITIYRDGSRSVQVLTAGTGYKPAKAAVSLCPTCPECSAPIEAGEGCFKCLVCGYSKCS
ncbi:MAG: adenosylcobalamin-dependent ribonucleoside-diphosphate reductase [Candidatus Babeliaceae bacterium]|nr:adenosylcobalamin-dependent ribonucleoside-diphosphate reductase [Candidatus Babeliaceae bacterium]